MKCPVCNVDLTMSERQGVEIDYCPKCRGVWLDRGELDKIIERSSENEKNIFQQSQQLHSQHSQHQTSYNDHYKYKKRKGFLGDILDFD